MNSLSQDIRYPDWDSWTQVWTLSSDPVCSVVHVYQNMDAFVWTIEYTCYLFQADTLLDSVMDRDEDPEATPHINTIGSVSFSKMLYTDQTNMFQFAADE
jgi:hypothetical protein